MFVNHKRRAIFIDIPKVASTYITQQLKTHYGFNRVHRFTSEQFSKGQDICEIGNTDFHSNEIQSVANMDDLSWNSYTKFCFVRNPYDRFISGFNYLGKDTNMAKMNFETFLDESSPHTWREILHTFASQKSFITDKRGKCLVDHILRFEHLETDFQWMLKKVGFKEEEIVHNVEKKNEKRHPAMDKYITNSNILHRLNAILDQDLRRFGYWRILGMWHLPYYTPKYWEHFLFVMGILLGIFSTIICLVFAMGFIKVLDRNIIVNGQRFFVAWLESARQFPAVVSAFWQFAVDKIRSKNPWFEEEVLDVES